MGYAPLNGFSCSSPGVILFRNGRCAYDTYVPNGSTIVPVTGTGQNTMIPSLRRCVKCKASL